MANPNEARIETQPVIRSARLIADGKVGDLTDEELAAVLKQVATPAVNELRKRGYNVQLGQKIDVGAFYFSMSKLVKL